MNERHATHGGHQARTRARRAAVQALYQWQLGGQNLSEIERQFLDMQDMSRVDVPFFRELLHRVPAQVATLDVQLAETLDRPIEQVDPVERAVLRIGAYELNAHPEIPWRVVINEAVELAKRFGGEQSHRFVNGSLDRLAASVRSREIRADKRQTPSSV